MLRKRIILTILVIAAMTPLDYFIVLSGRSEAWAQTLEGQPKKVQPLPVSPIRKVPPPETIKVRLTAG